MTTRDFTPTEESVEALAWALRNDITGDYIKASRMMAAKIIDHPAFQSIIAAAKAEARAEIVEELEAIDLIVPSETSEHEWGIDEATRAIIKLIRSKDEEASA